MTRTGKVYLIGAGPGDIELLTLKATRRMALADVVLMDDLVNPEVLQYVRPDAKVISVGKRGGCKSTPQKDIERQILDFARAGLAVARLKGGDPFIFGRGGEEMQTVMAAGIEVEVINGITAGLAAPATLGIPLTHRNFVQGVTFVTGHSRADKDPEWETLAQSGMTLVIYMGMRRIEQITEALLKGGLSSETPAAAIQHGSNVNQRQTIATLATLAESVRREGLGSPAITIVGEVVSLANSSIFKENL